MTTSFCLLDPQQGRWRRVHAVRCRWCLAKMRAISGLPDTAGCNSRVFRATLRPRRRDQQTSSVNGNGAKRKRCQDAPPASMASPSVPAAVSGSGAEGGHSSGTSSSIPPQAGSVADGVVGFGERFLTGSFGSCFTGNYANSRQGGTEAREASRAGRADGRVGTEWAIKMALTLVGQDPIQAQQEMETEIAILVGGRIPPHANIMRGVHSFQDDIGQDLQPVLWDGLGADVGKTLSPRTSFVVMPLFTAGSLQALLNKRRTRCKGPPFLRLLDVMRYLEQMLSAVNHLLAFGVAHNDIKPDNWLLRADQRTIVLTDFGACIDSQRPPTSRGHPSCSPAVPTPSAPTPHLHATATAAGRGEALTAPRTLTPCRSMGGGGGGGDGHGGASAATLPPPRGWSMYKGTLLASATAKSGASANPFLPASKRTGLTGKFPSGGGADKDVDAASRGNKRRRYCAGSETSDSWRTSQRGGGPARFGDEPGVPPKGPSEELKFPFSRYFTVGAASIVAPELAQAWREETDLDYRRSDVFSVGVCLYRMLRPDPVYIDNGTGLEGKETASPSGVQESWPLPLFRNNKGGCPDEVSELCHGLLHPDPSKRQTAEQGCSVASWLVSCLESANRGDEKGSTVAASGPAVRDVRRERPPQATCPDEHRKMRAASSAGGGDGGGASATSSKVQHLVFAPVDRHQHSLGRTIPPMPSWRARANQERRRDQMPVLPSGDAGRNERKEGGVTALLRDAAARLASRKEECRLREPEELVRSDRVSHMRDAFPNASPEDLFRALDTRGWNVAQACADFGDGKSGNGVCGGRPTVDLERTCMRGDSVEGTSGPHSWIGLWFGNVAEELRRQERETFSPGRGQPFPGLPGQMPSSRFRR